MDDAEWEWPRAFVTDGLVGRPWSARAFGGGTAFYAGISFRYRLIDFDAGDHVSGDALDPRWPIAYDDLRPFYDEVERRIGIARTDTGDPLAPPSPPAVLPPHPYSLAGGLIADAGHTLGLRPFYTPLAINSKPYGGRPRCESLTPCNEYTCPIGARADAVRVFLDGLDDGLTIVFGGRALRIDLARPDRAGWIEWLDLANRARHRTRVGLVVLAANAVQSSALLLRSAQRWAPAGLGNSNDMVGRGLSFKVSGSVRTWLPLPRNRVGPVTGPHSTVSMSDFYLAEDGPSGLGGQVYENSPESRAVVAGRVPVRLHFVAGDQPVRGNRVRLVKELDEFGTPHIAIDYLTHPLDAERLRYLETRASEVLVAAGAEAISIEKTFYERGSRHLHGGARAGSDPRVSVVDRDGRVHDLENVHIVDGSYFPFAGGVNPTLTIQANALRISRALAPIAR
jgi:6'''-hydroxyparomomycin oxidase